MHHRRLRLLLAHPYQPALRRCPGCRAPRSARPSPRCSDDLSNQHRTGPFSPGAPSPRRATRLESGPSGPPGPTASRRAQGAPHDGADDASPLRSHTRTCADSCPADRPPEPASSAQWSIRSELSPQHAERTTTARCARALPPCSGASPAAMPPAPCRGLAPTDGCGAFHRGGRHRGRCARLQACANTPTPTEGPTTSRAGRLRRWTAMRPLRGRRPPPGRPCSPETLGGSTLGDKTSARRPRQEGGHPRVTPCSSSARADRRLGGRAATQRPRHEGDHPRKPFAHLDDGRTRRRPKVGQPRRPGRAAHGLPPGLRD